MEWKVPDDLWSRCGQITNQQNRIENSTLSSFFSFFFFLFHRRGENFDDGNRYKAAGGEAARQELRIKVTARAK